MHGLSTWEMLKAISADQSLIFEATTDAELQPMRCHTDMRGHAYIVWVLRQDGDKCLDFIPIRSDWKCANRNTRSPIQIGHINNQYAQMLRIDDFAEKGKAYDIFCVEVDRQ